MKMKRLRKNDNVSFTIKRHGAPIVNSVYIREISKNIAAIEIDMKSKYCEIDYALGGSDGSCGIHITADDRSRHLNDLVNRGEPTIIEFTDFKGWDVFSCSSGRYTLKICLIRKQSENFD